MKEEKRAKKADQFFRREIQESDVARSVHYSFKDGFRLGFGFFVGFGLASLVVILIAAAVNAVFKMF